MTVPAITDTILVHLVSSVLRFEVFALTLAVRCASSRTVMIEATPELLSEGGMVSGHQRQGVSFPSDDVGWSDRIRSMDQASMLTITSGPAYDCRRRQKAAQERKGMPVWNERHSESTTYEVYFG